MKTLTFRVVEPRLQTRVLPPTPGSSFQHSTHHRNEKPSSPEVFLLALTEPRLGEGFTSFLPFSMCNNIKAISFCIKELERNKPLQLQLNSSYSTKKKKKMMLKQNLHAQAQVLRRNGERSPITWSLSIEEVLSYVLVNRKLTENYKGNLVFSLTSAASLNVRAGRHLRSRSPPSCYRRSNRSPETLSRWNQSHPANKQQSS